jgi:hypothetical protein
LERVVVPARQDTQPGGVGSLESILGLLKSLKILALVAAGGLLNHPAYGEAISDTLPPSWAFFQQSRLCLSVFTLYTDSFSFLIRYILKRSLPRLGLAIG